jgi:predicted DCC family thiol-disulfide oxidoreductase YuxK
MENQQYSHLSIVLFDGVCNLCNWSVNFIIERDKKNKFKFASLQSAVAKDIAASYGFNPNKIKTIILLDNGKIYNKSSAALLIAKNLRAFWPLLYYFFIWIPTSLRDSVYDYIATNRYKWFGKREFCSVPTEQNKSRFL